MKVIRHFNFILALIFVFSLLTASFLQPPSVFSADFTTSYDINFAFDLSGKAKVTQKIQLKNQSDSLYASEYSLTIGSTRVSNVSGSDGLGGILVKASKKSEQTVLTAKLNDKVVGKGKIASLTINYTIEDLAIKRGQIWEVNIPKILTQEEVDKFAIKVFVPVTYGKLHSITPNPASSKQIGNNFVYSFGKASLKDNISASFGTIQQFKFDLKYRLRNKNVLNAIGTIALPPDRDQQQIFLTKLSPRPRKIYVDKDGNYLADYSVKGRSNLEIDVSGIARLSDQTETLQTMAQETQENLQEYLKPDKYWEVENATIQKKAKELGTTREIYKFVTQTLNYNYDRLKQETPERFGAVRALQEKTNSICTDFTDLFIALARAAGIPARELEGFAYTDNANTRPTKVGGLETANVLHAWPEYYDREKGRWVAVDPTWEATTGGVNYFDKLDTNHLVFVTHGISSQWPIPAGGYKLEGSETDDLKVDFDTTTPDTNVRIEADFDFGKAIGGIPSSGRVTIRNVSGRAFLQPKVNFEISGAKLSSSARIEESVLLPFETKTYELKITAGKLLFNQKQLVKVNLSGFVGEKEQKEVFEETVLIKPFFLSLNPVSVLAVLAFLSMVLLYPPVFRSLVRPSLTRLLKVQKALLSRLR